MPTPLPAARPPLSPRLFLPPPVAALGDDARILLKAMRLWVMLARNGRSPRPPLRALLGPAAPGFAMLMELVVAAWPDPFTTYPPCATAVSPDEDCLISLLAFAAADLADGFDRQLADLLPPCERARLWRAAGRLAAERAGLG